METKVVVTMLVNGEWRWKTEAKVDSQFVRRMSPEELEIIAVGTAEIIRKVAGRTAEESTGPEATSERKKKR